MILLDTQVCVWWTTNSGTVSTRHREIIDAREIDGIDRITVIPTLHILPATPQILLDSTSLPGDFHPDPADRIIVATARAHAYELLTTDAKILAYGHVRSIGPT